MWTQVIKPWNSDNVLRIQFAYFFLASKLWVTWLLSQCKYHYPRGKGHSQERKKNQKNNVGKAAVIWKRPTDRLLMKMWEDACWSGGLMSYKAVAEPVLGEFPASATFPLSSVFWPGGTQAFRRMKTYVCSCLRSIYELGCKFCTAKDSKT